MGGREDRAGRGEAAERGGGWRGVGAGEEGVGSGGSRGGERNGKREGRDGAAQCCHSFPDLLSVPPSFSAFCFLAFLHLSFIGNTNNTR